MSSSSIAVLISSGGAGNSTPVPSPSSSSSFSQLTPSLILFVSNMNLPTLYFWLSSAASTYFHPSTVPQIAQLTSLTVCWPVTRFLGTALFWYVLGRPEACTWVWLGWP